MSRPRVETAYGVVEGGTVTAPDGSTVHSFLGIPYAASTAGEQRWRAPTPPHPWPGVRPAITFGPAAPQADPLPTPLPGFKPDHGTSEDCLSVNVWTPGLDGAQRPVMVWIHGGAYTSGGSAQPVYDAARLVSEGDVMVVTMNYRLGALGFLALGGDTDANCGLLDQLAALRWVREHARVLGGDPRRMTVFGESAGAGSILHLAASPLGRDAFDGAIAQSGEPRTLGAGQASEVAAAFARHLGLRRADPPRLRGIPVSRLLDAQTSVIAELAASMGMMPLAPVLDGRVCDLDVTAAFAAGRAASVPLVIGTTREELRLFPDPRSTGVDDPRLGRWVAKMLSTDERGAARAVDTYRATLGPHATNGDVWEAVRTDAMMRVPNLRVAEAQAQHQTSTFVYRFDWSAPGLGAAHAIDVPFTFGTFDREGWGEVVGHDQRAERLGTAMRAAWTAFARTGDPSWPAYETRTRPTMIFDADCRVELDPDGATSALYL